MSASVLVVDDEKTICETLAWCLQQEGHRVGTAGSGEEALRLMETEEFDVIITDIIMPGIGGLEVLQKARELNPRAVVILVTAYATVETAVRALREGASDYVLKPFKLDDLKFRVQRLLEYRTAFQESGLFRRTVEHAVPEKSLLGESAAMRGVRAQVAKISPTPSNVLITGESGTGKELAARALHAASPRHAQPFVPINCGAIPEALLESQLFGHLRGAFTTAVQASPGLFAAADRGTIFLDEIGDLPLHLQVKLLRVIEEKQVWAVGSTKPVLIDVRIIASTNRDLVKAIEGGGFREDLFYRLNVVHIALPPLRERREDIPILVEHFIHALNLKLSTKFLGVDRDVLGVLMNHPWKGNVRELEHVLESAMILGEGEVVSVRDLPHYLVTATEGSTVSCALRDVTRRVERQHILAVLAQTQFDKKEAARLLGISLASLYRKIGELAIQTNEN
ncbi:MAG TPA: sigma-54 dependent transcriptional regulator [Methylomirabilota bacterium]|jgi:two-component system response regulator PilR (NtrC family)|nr:sigma-54 dependent transcriptional regulator [Methylomirabilota bacterium]